MFCQNCGAQLPENVLFCPKCGTPVSEVIQGSYGNQNATQQQMPYGNQNAAQQQIPYDNQNATQQQIPYGNQNAAQSKQMKKSRRLSVPVTICSIVLFLAVMVIILFATGILEYEEIPEKQTLAEVHQKSVEDSQKNTVSSSTGNTSVDDVETVPEPEEEPETNPQIVPEEDLEAPFCTAFPA